MEMHDKNKSGTEWKVGSILGFNFSQIQIFNKETVCFGKAARNL